MTGVSFYYFLWRLISVRRVRASNGRQNRFLYRSHRNGQSRKNIVFMRLCGVSGIHFSRRGEQIILLFFIAFIDGNRLIASYKPFIENGKILAASGFAGAYLARQGYTLSAETALLPRNSPTAKGVIYHDRFPGGKRHGLPRKHLLAFPKRGGSVRQP